MSSEGSRMTMQGFVVQELTTFIVANDGAQLHMNFTCQDVGQVSLSFPTECLQGLMMTLPQMMNQAIRTRYRDQSLRLVYPAENIRIELSSDPKTLIVTLTTPDGFEVSFGLTRQQMTLFSGTMGDIERMGSDVKIPKAN